MSRSVLVLGALVACACPELHAQQRASMFRGNAAHTGVFQALPGRHLMGLQWRFPTDGSVTAVPTISNGVVYAGSGDGYLYALDLSTGALRWRFAVNSPIASSPAIGNNTIYVATRAGELHAVSLEGRALWHVPLGADLPLVWGHENGDYYTSSPVLTQDVLVIAGGGGRVFALDARTGAERWHYDTNARVRTSPALANGTVYVGAHDGRVYALNLADGKLRWKFETLGVTLNSANFGFDRKTIQSSPAVADNTVFVGSRDGFLYALDANTGAKRWSFDHQVSWVNTPPSVNDGVVYAGSSDAHFVQAVDAKTGREVWRAPTTNVVWGGIAVTGDQVLASDFSGALYSFDRGSGQQVWRFAAKAAIHSGAVVANGLVVFGSADGGVYALNISAQPVARAVFFDSTYRKTATGTNPEAVLRILQRAGYEPLNAEQLTTFLRARIADRQPSVVVFAIDHLAPGIGDGGQESLLRRYLESGGKVVWTGTPPGLRPRDPQTGAPGEMSAIKWNAPGELLGFSFERSIFGPRGAHVTDAGKRWGLSGWWQDAWSVRPDQVSEVLAADEEGLAASWVRNYAGRPGTGFVRAPIDDPFAIYLLAEYRPK